jgi:hypothetical protein
MTHGAAGERAKPAMLEGSMHRPADDRDHSHRRIIRSRQPLLNGQVIVVEDAELADLSGMTLLGCVSADPPTVRLCPVTAGRTIYRAREEETEVLLKFLSGSTSVHSPDKEFRESSDERRDDREYCGAFVVRVLMEA